MANNNYDETIMNQLLSEPQVKGLVARMTDQELEFYKSMLVQQGTYARYAIEKQKTEVKQILKGEE